jgi:choline/glycine/proline betaine transport protein
VPLNDQDSQEVPQMPESAVGFRPRVFVPSAAVIAVLVASTAFAPDRMSGIFGGALAEVVRLFGWWYILLAAACIAFAAVLGVSRYGAVKIGPDDATPEFSRLSWYTMLFSAGIGIGVLFYGTAEAVTHFSSPPRGMEGETAESARYAIHITWMEWGIGAFAIYVVSGLAIAMAVHRRGRPLSIRWALEPVLGNRVHGWIGDLVDIIAILATVFGLSTSLGLGALQLNTGLSFLGWADVSQTTQLLLIAGIGAIAAASVLSGVSRGIKWLSNFNVGLAMVLLTFVLIAGPTLFVLEATVAQVGYYTQNILQSTLETDFVEGDAWQSYWTTFFWAWWVSWGPFVGTFLARISRGRSVKEFCLGVMLIPAGGIFLWFSIMGWSAIHREMFGQGGLAGLPTEHVLFEFLSGLPFSTLSSLLAIMLIVTFFVTSADSGALVMATLSSGGSPSPSPLTRGVWCLMLIGMASVLLTAGGLGALQTAAVVGGLPFTVVIVLMAASAVRDSRQAMIEQEIRQIADNAGRTTSELGGYEAPGL